MSMREPAEMLRSYLELAEVYRKRAGTGDVSP